MLLISLKQSVAIVLPLGSLEVPKKPRKPRFMASSISLSEVSQWLSSFYKAILLVVDDLWFAKLQEVWFAVGSLKVPENLLSLCCNPLIFQLFMPSSIYQIWKLDRNVLVIRILHRLCKSHCFNSLLVQSSAFVEIKVCGLSPKLQDSNTPVFSSWLDYLLDKLLLLIWSVISSAVNSWIKRYQLRSF